VIRAGIVVTGTEVLTGIISDRNGPWLSERLRELGYPVDALTGPTGGYRLHAGTAMPPLLLDDDEAVAIAVGLLRRPARPVQQAWS